MLSFLVLAEEDCMLWTCACVCLSSSVNGPIFTCHVRIKHDSKGTHQL